MSDAIPFDALKETFDAHGGAAGIQALLDRLRADGSPHGVFRALLLKKRFELGLPLINPGDLHEFPDSLRKAYESYVEEACRQTGLEYLKDGKIVEAWRYFRSVGDRTPMREALEKIDPAAASDEVLQIALDEGVDPKRGFEIVLKRDGLCRTLTVLDSARGVDLAVRKHVSGIMAQSLYTELVIGVSKQIFERFGEIPPETDLVDLIRYRPWLFENANTHADPTHISAVSRYGLLCDTQPELIMTLSINEYGRLMDKRFGAATDAPFEDGFVDHIKYARALLGENAEETADHFMAKLSNYDPGIDPGSIEWIVSLVYRTGQKRKALDLWLKHLSENPPEAPGQFIPSFYELCIDAKEFELLAHTARSLGDVSAWAGAQMLLHRDGASAAVSSPAPASPPPLQPPPPPASTPPPAASSEEDLS